MEERNQFRDVSEPSRSILGSVAEELVSIDPGFRIVGITVVGFIGFRVVYRNRASYRGDYELIRILLNGSIICAHFPRVKNPHRATERANIQNPKEFENWLQECKSYIYCQIKDEQE